jgi:hypothetical protein
MENLKEVLKDLEDLREQTLDTSLIEDNAILFAHGENLYKVKMPSQKQSFVIEKARDKRYLELLEDKDLKTRRQIKAILKDRDIDIDAIEEEKEQLLSKQRDIQMELAIKRDGDDKIEEYIDELRKIRVKFLELSMEITSLLSASLETKLENYFLEYTTFECTYKLVGEDDKLERAFINYEEFENDESGVVKSAIACMGKLFLSTQG